MGLDMYLYAARHAPGLDELARAASEVRYDEEDEWYLPRWDHYGPERKAATDDVIAAAGMRPLVGPETNHATYGDDGTLTVVATCWRKANQVHAWFVRNVQDGVDECQLSREISVEELAKLVADCKAALAACYQGDKARAAEIMPPEDGCFFGSTDLDEWYESDLAQTIAEVERAVRAAIEVTRDGQGPVAFHYQSSW